MSIFEVNTVEDLQSIVGSAFGGSGLGYGVAGGGASGVGDHYGTLEVNAFHIEFDTCRQFHMALWGYQSKGQWYRYRQHCDHNQWQLRYALHLGEVSLEDNQWHQVEIRIQGSNVQVLWDNAVLMQDDVGALRLREASLGLPHRAGPPITTASTTSRSVESCTFEPHLVVVSCAHEHQR